MKNLAIPLTTTIALAFIVLNKLTSQKDKSSTSKTLNSPFECGFSNQMKIHTSMANNFFIFSMLFLILELEIILIMPFTTSCYKGNMSNYSFYMTIIIILMIMIMEWKSKILIWSS